MADGRDYFFAERYRGLAEIDRFPSPIDAEVREAIERIRTHDETPESDPVEFSQELLFSTDPDVKTAYLSRDVLFPFYSRVGDEKFWRSLRSQAPYLERLQEQCPQLDIALIEQLWIERASGMPAAFASPSEQRLRWRSVAKWALEPAALNFAPEPYAAVVVVPRWGVGGSEKVMRELIESMERLTGRRSLVVVADTTVDPRALPPDVVCLPNLEYREEPFLKAPTWARVEALLDLILATRAPRVISINSFIGNALLQDGPLQSRGISTAAAMFCIALGPGGAIEGYIQIADWLIDAGVTLFTDNEHMARMMAAENFYDATVVLPVPVALNEGAAAGKGRHVLWAGRIDSQKRPDLLLEIAQMSPDLTYEVWGAPVLAENPIMAAIESQPNILYRGGFDGFEAIDTSVAGCLLYTSAYDGTPNILLEAMASGLPCVATAVGGIPDLMTGGRGLLLAPDAPAADYVGALRGLLADSGTREALSRAGRDHVRRAHTLEAFDRGVARLLAATPDRTGDGLDRE